MAVCPYARKQESETAQASSTLIPLLRERGISGRVVVALSLPRAQHPLGAMVGPAGGAYR